MTVPKEDATERMAQEQAAGQQEGASEMKTKQGKQEGATQADVNAAFAANTQAHAELMKVLAKATETLKKVSEGR